MLSMFHAYLNSTEAVGSQEALTLCSDVSPAPLKQVDDGGPAMPSVGAVLGQAEPKQGHQNEQLHAFSGGSKKNCIHLHIVCIYTPFFYLC